MKHKKKELKDILRQLRKENGLSRKKVGEIVGSNERNYANWEQGTSNPKIEYLIALSEFYNVTIDYLVGHENKKK